MALRIGFDRRAGSWQWENSCDGIWGKALASHDLGTKRLCSACGAKFYDLNKNPIVCPKCGHEEALNTGKAKRKTAEATPAAPEEKKKKKVADEEGDDEESGNENETSLDELAEEEAAGEDDDDDDDDFLDIDDEDEDDDFLDDDDEDDDVSGLISGVDDDDDDR